MKKREANFELLRIIAMLMIITLHYLDKGGILPEPVESFTAAGLTVWGLEALCVPAVNLYVLLSAYFLAEQEYRPGRVCRLWGTVLFYSLGLFFAAVLTGIVPVNTLDIYQAMNYCFPVIEEHYWFVTAYLLMYLFAPLMNQGLKQLSVKTYRQALFLLLLVLSVSASLLPVQLPTDRMGYDALWFLCLYLIGAYLRYHGCGLLSRGLCLAGYAVSCILIFSSLLFVHFMYDKTGRFAEFINRQYHYNSILCVSAAVFLLLFFQKLHIGGQRASAVICRVASTSFGVYLLHEHLTLRYLWPQLLGTERFADTLLFLPHWIVSILLVYTVGMLVDFGRQYLFRGKWFHDKKE